MSEFSDRILRSALFASICALPPLGTLLVCLGRPQVSASPMPFIALGAAGPAFPFLAAAGWYTSLRHPAEPYKAIVPAITWFLVALIVHLLVRKTWLAAGIMIAIFFFTTAINFLLLVRYV